MDQAQHGPGAGQPAQRLLRPASPTGLPAPQRLPHLPDFQTTPAFLNVHRRQRDETRGLIATAEADGRRYRLAANHRHVHGNLDQLIDTPEAMGDSP